VTCDGTILACDKEISSVAMYYRYLQNPPDPKWLKSIARGRLSKSDRRKPDRVTEEQNRMQAEHQEMMHRLAKLCSMSDAEWSERAARIQNRVEKIAASANARQEQKAEDAEEEADESCSAWIARLLKEPQPPLKITVVEELDYHVMCENPPVAALADIESHPEKFPGMKIVKQVRRFYPQGNLAANVLGYLGPEEKDWVGKQGIEKSCETILQGRRGTAIDITQHDGRVLSTSYRQKPTNGIDITLTLDFPLQQSAEELLDSAIERRQLSRGETRSAGGAIVVMEIADGSLRALAAAPRFDPNLFQTDRASEIAALLDDPGRPLIDRTCRMAIAPGSVFKILTAVALLESGGVDPEEPFFCQGYLNRPEQERCAIFVRQGVGHGETTLADALCVSCNVYFFNHAGRIGPDPLVDWAERFGFGRVTGVDLPSEAAGVVPNPENIERLERHAWKPSDTRALSVGQGSLTVSPMQIARLMAAVAGEGNLVLPHVKRRTDFQSVQRSTDRLETCPTKISGVHEKTLQVIREGLQRVVADPAGTAHGSVYLPEIAIAGKTGTAETGDSPSHAWFAGYVPVDKPKYVFVIALERAGESAATAGPVAKRLVLRMKQLGML
jgi:penicillin-binding protein 2